jgi:hypothetical protein
MLAGTIRFFSSRADRRRNKGIAVCKLHRKTVITSRNATLRHPAFLIAEAPRLVIVRCNRSLWSGIIHRPNVQTAGWFSVPPPNRLPNHFHDPPLAAHRLTENGDNYLVKLLLFEEFKAGASCRI